MDILPTNLSSFRSPAYWNEFYSNPKLENFEWYCDIKNILPTFYKCILERENVPNEESNSDFRDSVVVNVGCGNSNLHEVLMENGFSLVYNLDFSDQVLNELRSKSRGNRSMSNRNRNSRYKDNKSNSGSHSRDDSDEDYKDYNIECENNDDSVDGTSEDCGAYFVNVDVSKEEYVEFGEMLNKKYYGKRKIIVDKAFLDAFISIDENESKELIRTRSKIYLENTFNMMNYDDVFIIISVSQDYVIMELMRNTLMKNIYIDIYPVFGEKDRKAHMIQFVYAIYKVDSFKYKLRKQCRMMNMPNMPVEYFEVGQMLKKIKMAKTTIYLGPTIRKHTPGRRLAFDIYPSNQNDTCFSVVVYDSSSKSGYRLQNGCIIVPTGHEHLWLYSSLDGNQELANTAGARRLLLIWLKYVKDVNNLLRLNPLESYSDEKIMEYIESNLAETLDFFSLEESDGVTIMRVGESAKIKRWICEVASKYAGKIIVRDMYYSDDDNSNVNKNNSNRDSNSSSTDKTSTTTSNKDKEDRLYCRQMIFSSNPQVIQSEVLYYEEENKPVFVFNHPTNEYHVAIALSMGFLPSKGKILILGGGTGVLTNILNDLLENRFEVVELDEAVLFVAREYFGYNPENGGLEKELEKKKEKDRKKDKEEENKSKEREKENEEDTLERVESSLVHKLDRVMDLSKEDDSSNQKVVHITGDALEYIKKTKENYSAVILDINNGNESYEAEEQQKEEKYMSSGYLMSPNPGFLESEALESMCRLVDVNKGILVLNLLTRSKETKRKVLDKIKTKFRFIGVVKTPNDINEVLVCSNGKMDNSSGIFEKYAHLLKDKKFQVKNLDSWVNRFSVYSE